MPSKTNEQALEECVEKALLDNGFIKGESRNFNKQNAIDERIFWSFLELSQNDELEKLKREPEFKQKIIQRLDRKIKKDGILKILQNGLKVDDASFRLFYPSPLGSSGETIKKQFTQNIFSVTRQVAYSTVNSHLTLDMVIFLNGLPIITIELKNAWTGQCARVHGINQYKKDRDKNEPLLNFARCLVHFAIDTDEAYMSTRLNGHNTFFLPFNKGLRNGAGNPPNPNGHKSAYIWEDIFTKQTLANLIEHFIKLVKTNAKKPDTLENKTLFFPRFHQLDVVRKLTEDVIKNGVGKTYLIQHSAGSGKSNSITWCAYRLIEAYHKDSVNPIFDSVIVVTDRRFLDNQLGQNIASFNEVKSILARVESAQELKESLENGKKIIITTIQKFPFIVDGISNLSHKKFAIIIDEAHSSQSGTAHATMNVAMGSDDDNEYTDVQDKLLEIIKDKKLKPNASYFAFTATPKNTTLEKFGTKQDDGSFKPFHLYSMKQAIEEGFILDVLSNYTTYKSYYELEKSISENPLFNTKKAQKMLRSFVEKNSTPTETKAKIMLEHFIENVVKTKKLQAKAKGMIVTADIKTAITYYKAVTKRLNELGSPFKAIIAFSGAKEIDAVEYTEEDLNGFASKDIDLRFDENEYKLLIVANKYLTGFDQPKLCAMYVDKKLQGVLCVQALSRLNRSAPKYGKKTEDLFVLDFYNKIEDIKASFDPFYTSTTLSEQTDVNVLHELKEKLDEFFVYEQGWVNEFVEKFFNGKDAQELSVIIDKAAARFNQELELDDEQKPDFKIKAKQFVKIYAQICSIIPFEMVEWEKLFWFLKFLIPKLIIKDKNKDAVDELLNSVDLSTYGLQRVKLSSQIELDENDTKVQPQNSNPRSSHSQDQKDPLDEIINNFNEKWFQGWGIAPQDQKMTLIKLADSVKAHKKYKEHYKENNDDHTKTLTMDEMIKEFMIKIVKNSHETYKQSAKDRKNSHETYRKFTQDEAFRIGLRYAVQRMLG